ncbi:cysteine-rich CWC family protein [Alkalihalophilus lindianensis]|uniref:Cysteine-rich CWC family protein n=1 Tax=Alkalihalophilus lindianensis TaxID=1630542 RepID=A0ABU3XG18_9BACI|nr:cysteine-rich CWC family protein [Alkalihalophilus lindianensis]MDV2686829.1 cysteine-rich CWC family protein [Alkalihalophilus lindianensis]
MANKYCPLCGEENKCMAGTVEHGNCWCDREGEFPNGIFKLVPSESSGKHCICKKCVNKYREEAGD